MERGDILDRESDSARKRSPDLIQLILFTVVFLCLLVILLWSSTVMDDQASSQDAARLGTKLMLTSAVGFLAGLAGSIRGFLLWGRSGRMGRSATLACTLFAAIYSVNFVMLLVS